MSKKEKDKDKDKKKKKKQKKLLEKIKVAANCKAKCCEKYKKSESKRCSRCPMFDLIKKVA